MTKFIVDSVDNDSFEPQVVHDAIVNSNIDDDQKAAILSSLGFKEHSGDIILHLRFNKSLLDVPSDDPWRDDDWKYMEGYTEGKTGSDIPLGRILRRAIDMVDSDPSIWFTTNARDHNSFYFNNQSLIGIVGGEYAPD